MDLYKIMDVDGKIFWVNLKVNKLNAYFYNKAMSM